ncbi:hypothetical protein ABPG75_013715 [Micractinium tetrahymenae]
MAIIPLIKCCSANKRTACGQPNSGWAPRGLAVGRAGRPAATHLPATCALPAALMPSVASPSKTHFTFWIRVGPAGSQGAAMAGGESLLIRAGSWQAQSGPQLLKTTSDLLLQAQAFQQPKGVSRLLAEEGKTNSVDSSSTAAGQSGAAHTLLHDSATATLLPPLRQISLDVIAATELNRTKGLGGQERERGSQNIFQDVFNELAGKDELAPLQAGQLYTLPSMQFLESMLSDFDAAKHGGGAAGGSGMGGPLDLSGDVFDMPDYPPAAQQLRQPPPGLRPTPFEQQHLQQPHLLHPQAAAVGPYGGSGLGPAPGPSGYGFVPTGGSAPAQLGSMHGSSSSGSMTLQASMRAHSAYVSTHPGMAPAGPGAAHLHVAHSQSHAALLADQEATQRHIAMLQQQQAAAMAAAARPPPGHAAPGVRQPAVPQPAQPRATPRRTSQAYADFEYEEAEVSLQTSKSGRVRKVASFTGVKRKLDVAHASESRDSRGSVGPDPSAGEVGSKGSKGRKTAGGAKNRKGRRTVCLNCGCHQTPQWRCGPLGPRTLCNACGVRYKKDLPLNCWPIRDGMVLPPGAVLPQGFVVPPGITIHTQPADWVD